MLNLEESHRASAQMGSSRNLDNLPFLIVLAVVAIATLLKFLFFREYLGSNFLFQDDTIFLGHYLFRTPMSSPPTQDLYYGLVNIFTVFGGIFAAKCSLILVQIAIGMLFYLIINVFARASLLSLSLALMFVHLPVAIDQNFFVVGAHPQFGALMLLSACYLLLVGPFIERSFFSKKSIFLLAGSAVFVAAGLRSSPTLVLVPLVVFSAVVYLLVRDGLRSKFDARHVCAAVILSAIPVLALFNGDDYHYAALEGWTDVSLDQVLSNFVTAIYSVVVTPFNGALWLKFIWLASLVVVALIIVRAVLFPAERQVQHTRTAWAYVIFLLALAAVLFGPGSIVTNYLDRYVIAPYYFSALSVACVLGVCARSVPRSPTLGRTVRAIYILPLAGIATVWFSGHSTHLMLAPYQDTHSQTVAALDGIEVVDDDQIVVLHSDARGLATSGFNHWSTWYLRVLTNNSTVIGLVGTQSMYDAIYGSVFVEEYKDHDGRFWSNRDGRSSRIRMIGLEVERPIHVLAELENGVLAPTDVIVSNGDGMRRRVPFGARFEEGIVDGAFAGDLCQKANSGDAAVLTAAPTSGAADAILAAIVGRPVEFQTSLLDSGFSSSSGEVLYVDLSVERKDIVEINLELIPSNIDSGNAPYSDTFPPMPVLSSAIAIYHTGDAFILSTREDPSQSFRIPLESGVPFKMKLIGCVGGTAAIFVNEQAVGHFSDFMPNGRWSLGKGFLERTWSGQFRTFDYKRYVFDYEK